MNSRSTRCASRRLGKALVCSGTLLVTACGGSDNEARTALSEADCTALAGAKPSAAAAVKHASVVSGTFTPPGSTTPITDLPPFCRVVATSTPVPGSEIDFEVWLPMKDWNRRMTTAGNGQLSGSIVYSGFSSTGLADQLRKGYAAGSSNGGHYSSGNDGSWALGQPEKVADWGYRAAHETAVSTKEILRRAYGDGPAYSYYDGCSTGGRQGHKIAQEHPEDFDGIFVGAPADANVRLNTFQLYAAHAALLNGTSGASYIPPSKWAVMNQAVIAACDARDGLADGVIEDPSRCPFDVKTLQCTGPDQPNCLTAAQLGTAQKMYAGVANPRTGVKLYPGFPLGSELSWGPFIAGPEPFPPSVQGFRYLVIGDPNWDWRTFDFDRDVALGDAKVGAVTSTMPNPNLSTYFARGGKMMQYHGWTDQLIPATSSVDYRDALVKAQGAAAIEASYRLFMVPGMDHCSGGIGTDTFDRLAPLREWVENGKAPSRISASRIVNGAVQKTRPLCAFPMVAKYKGSGDTASEASFDCVAP